MGLSPAETETLGYAPAVELVERYRSGELSPVEVVEAFLARIEAVNPKLNAYIALAPETARRRAAEAEKQWRRREAPGPLLGVPISIKDLTWTAGLPTTSGSHVFERRVPDRDAPVVARLRAGGAIILGKTNTSEFGWLAITDNDLFGRTNNPWDLTRTPSGSSGGAAAATAAGLAPISHGSDGGGSIRHPASFCGVFGLKPTFGLVPRHPGVDGWPTLSHHGPITRTVADAALALDVMAGFDPRDLTSAPLAPQRYLDRHRTEIRGWRVAWSADLGFALVDPVVREAFERAVPAFEELGCRLQPAAPPLEPAREIFKRVMSAEIVGADLRHIEADGTSRMNPDLTRFVWKRRGILAAEYLAAQEERQAMHAAVQDFFERFDLLLTPTMAIPPFPHPRSMNEYPREVNGIDVGSTGWHPFTFPFNLTGQPAASVPCGFTPDGLPIGLQIVGRRFEDLAVLQAAAAFEAARPWADRRPSL